MAALTSEGRFEAGHPARTYQNWLDISRRINMGGTAALDLVVSLLDTAPAHGDLALVGTGRSRTW